MYYRLGKVGWASFGSMVRNLDNIQEQTTHLSLILILV